MIGAGPAGSIAALRLARLGRRVLFLDKREFPRDKACGDALIPDAIGCLRRNGLWERVERRSYACNAATVFSPSRTDFDLTAEFVCVKRVTLDEELAQAAVRAGAVCCHAAAAEVSADPGAPARVVLAAVGDVVRAEVVIIATGADVSLLSPLGMVQRRAPSAVAIRCYLRSSYEIDRLIFSFDRSILPGYAWIFPLGDGEYNVGCGVFHRGAHEAVNLRGMLDRFLREFPIARRLREGMLEQGPIRGALLRCGLRGAREWNGSRIVTTGETVGATFPFSGEGIGKAMETAEYAAEAANEALRTRDAGRLEMYGRRLRERLRPKYVGYEAAERWLAHRAIADFVAKRTRRSEGLRSALAGIVAETVDPRRVFSLPGLLRACWT